MTTPEERARETIDAKLAESGWIVQSRDDVNLAAGPGIMVREFALTGSHGYADYMIFVDGKSVDVLEANLQGNEADTHSRLTSIVHKFVPVGSRSRSPE